MKELKSKHSSDLAFAISTAPNYYTFSQPEPVKLENPDGVPVADRTLLAPLTSIEVPQGSMALP